MNAAKLLHLVGFLLAMLALAWFAWQVGQSAAVFPEFGLREFSAIALCVGLYAIPAVVSGLVWHYLMRAVGDAASRPVRAVSINCVAQAGKYLPGNVAHYVGRVLLARQAGWGTTNTLFTIFIETLWSVGVAASLALLAGIFAGEQLPGDLAQVPRWQILLAIVAGALLAPLLGHRVFQMAAGVWARRKGVSLRALRVPPVRTFFLVVAVYLFNYLVMGAVLALVASLVFAQHPEPVFLLTGIYAVAWVAGLVTPGAPAGLGCARWFWWPP